MSPPQISPSASLGEFDLIARYFAPIAAPGALGLLDDAAIFMPSPGHDLVLTKDMLIEGVHFFADDPPQSIARKALRVNLSDLAAKGAMPRGFLLGLGYAGKDEAWFSAFAQALGEDAAHFACPLLGGDTVKAPVLTLSITAFGEVPSGQMVKRQGGQPGDAIYVSGTIGDAALGLKARLNPDAPWVKALGDGHRAFLLDRYLHPQPRQALAPVLRAYASGAMDISDGLVGDCDKLAAHLGREMQIESVPLSPAVRAAISLEPSLLHVVLTGGDDYELLMAVPPHQCAQFENAALQSGVQVARIGVLGTDRGESCWLDNNRAARRFVHRSYVHE